ncbi:MAG: tandem-95 repeat protein, partial [Thermoplasmata archaeon]
MKTSKLSLIILCILYILFLPYPFGKPVFGFSTHPTTTNISRTFDKIKAFRTRGSITDSIMVTISFKNKEPIDIRGFYYVDNIPQGLIVNTVSILVDGNDVTNYTEKIGKAGDIYNDTNTIPYRWILETPDTFNEDNPIGPGSTLEIIYSISSGQLGKFDLDEFHWIGYYQQAIVGERAFFGHSEDTHKQTITFENTPPVAYSQSVPTDEDVDVSITLTGYDGDGDPLTFIIVTGPIKGTLSVTKPNLTYMPNSNFYGQDSFTFKVNDGSVDSNIATVSINVNGSPKAADDTENTKQGTDVTINVIENDTDLDGTIDPNTVAIIVHPNNGSITINVDGTITYDPNDKFIGTDSFTYTVDDNEGATSNEVTVT